MKRLLGSSKAWVVLAALAGVVVLAALGRVQSDQALAAVKWLVVAFVGSTAVEDAAAKLGRPSVDVEVKGNGNGAP